MGSQLPVLATPWPPAAAESRATTASAPGIHWIAQMAQMNQMNQMALLRTTALDTPAAGELMAHSVHIRSLPTGFHLQAGWGWRSAAASSPPPAQMPASLLAPPRPPLHRPSLPARRRSRPERPRRLGAAGLSNRACPDLILRLLAVHAALAGDGPRPSPTSQVKAALPAASVRSHRQVVLLHYSPDAHTVSGAARHTARFRLALTSQGFCRWA